MAFNIESSTLTFAATDSATYTFTQKYDLIPIVTATVGNGDNVNVFVDSVNTSQAVIKLSESGNFTVYIQVIDRIIAWYIVNNRNIIWQKILEQVK